MSQTSLLLSIFNILMPEHWSFLEYGQILWTVGLIIFALDIVKNVTLVLVLESHLNNRGALPQLLQDFPTVGTSPEAYIATYNKVENFLEDALNGKVSELTLSETEINHLHRQGKSVNKYVRNIIENSPIALAFPGFFRGARAKYFYFEIMKEGILQRVIEYPLILSSRSGVKTESYLLSFEEINGNPSIRRLFYEKNGRIWRGPNRTVNRLIISIFDDDGVLETSLASSSLLLNIFGVTSPLLENPNQYQDTEEHQKVVNVLGQITDLTINDNQLLLKANSQ